MTLSPGELGALAELRESYPIPEFEYRMHRHDEGMLVVVVTEALSNKTTPALLPPAVYYIDASGHAKPGILS